MSNALWCDVDDTETNAFGQVGHPFSDLDPMKKHYRETEEVEIHTGNSYGTPTYQKREEVTVERDMCGYHREKRNPFLAKKEITPPANPTLEELEDDDAQYRAGYDAAMEKILSGKVDQ